MIIEIRKAGFVNKGAELMLYAALHKLREHFPEAKFVMAPSITDAPYIKRAELGLHQKAWFIYKQIQFGSIAGFAPKKIRDLYGVVMDKEVDVIIDAAGFSYSDQLGKNRVKELANSCKRWKRNGAKIILLPQALGPFNLPCNKKHIRKVIDMADLVFARDKVSYNHLIEAVGFDHPNIHIAPDFTNILDGTLPKGFDPDVHKFAVVPNYQMIAKTDKATSGTYIPFMAKCVKYALENNQKPFLLIHEGEKDILLAKQIAEAINNEVPIIRESNPLHIKGVLGACKGTIGSRFHGLVSALSQGVPSLATGWSHKYKMLFDDYSFGDGLLSVNASDQEIKDKFNLIIETESKKIIQKRISEKAELLKKQTKEMWSKVLGVIGQ